jgi:hypothetical protein
MGYIISKLQVNNCISTYRVHTLMNIFYYNNEDLENKQNFDFHRSNKTSVIEILILCFYGNIVQGDTWCMYDTSSLIIPLKYHVLKGQ